MSMQSLRETTDAREFETRLRALRNTNIQLDATDLAEIATLRNCIDECDEIARLINSSIANKDGDGTHCVASSRENAVAAIVHFADSRGEVFEIKEYGPSIEAWGLVVDTSDNITYCDINWYVIIRIIEETDL